MSEKYIYTEHLSKTYRVGRGKHGIETKALQDVNIEVQKGEFLCIMGSSGSGKSTLLHILGGIDSPSEGGVFYGKEDITKWKDSKLSNFRLRQTGFVFQFFHLLPELTIKQNILVPVKMMHGKLDKGRYEELLDGLGIKEKENQYPEQLSGGQQQRVAIARALINQPDVLLCDEPTGNLDSKNGEEVLKMLVKARDMWNQTILLVTHDRKIADYADRIIQLEDGIIV